MTDPRVCQPDPDFAPLICDAETAPDRIKITWVNGWFFLTDWWDGSAHGFSRCNRDADHHLKIVLDAQGGTTDKGYKTCFAMRALSGCFVYTDDDPKARTKNISGRRHCFVAEIQGTFVGYPGGTSNDPDQLNNFAERCVDGR